MDIFLPIIICLILIILFSLCGWCCKRHREGNVYGYGGTPVTVTTQHVSATPVVVPPYPVEPRHPLPPQSIAGPAVPGFMAMPGSGYTPYPSYPLAGVAQYPPAAPPVSASAAAPPPSYSEAMAHPPTNEIYAKQSPYNPNYQ